MPTNALIIQYHSSRSYALGTHLKCTQSTEAGPTKNDPMYRLKKHITELPMIGCHMGTYKQWDLHIVSPIERFFVLSRHLVTVSVLGYYFSLQ